MIWYAIVWYGMVWYALLCYEIEVKVPSFTEEFHLFCILNSDLQVFLYKNTLHAVL